MEREAALQDSAWFAGAKAGWNAANSPDPDGAWKQLEEARGPASGYLKVLKETRALSVSPAEDASAQTDPATR